jgi:integrase
MFGPSRSNHAKRGNAGKLKLPALALKVLKDLPRVKNNPYVFVATFGNGPINAFNQRKGELDEKLPKGMPPWVLHDLRRTARSLMPSVGVSSDIAERVLGHAIERVEDIYDRHGYFDQKSVALARLANKIDQIINPPPANVVTMQPRR